MNRPEAEQAADSTRIGRDDEGRREFDQEVARLEAEPAEEPEPTTPRGNLYLYFLGALALPLLLLVAVLGSLWWRTPPPQLNVPTPGTGTGRGATVAPGRPPEWQSLAEAVKVLDRRRAAAERRAAARAEQVTVQITSAPPGARIRWAGQELGQTPLTWSQAPAGQPLELTATLPGYQPAAVELIPAAGSQVHLALTVADGAAPGPTADGGMPASPRATPTDP